MSDKNYIILQSSLGLDNLEDQVNEMITKGFVPVGGVFPTSFNYGQPGGYSQAMFRPEQKG